MVISLLWTMYIHYQLPSSLCTVVRISRILPRMHTISFYPSCASVWITCIQMAIFKKSKEGKFWCTTLIIEAAFHLQKFCIDMHDSSIVGIGNFDPETFCPSYVEYLDPLGNNATLKSKRHAVHQAILQKIKSDGQR